MRDHSSICEPPTLTQKHKLCMDNTQKMTMFLSSFLKIAPEVGQQSWETVLDTMRYRRCEKI